MAPAATVAGHATGRAGAVLLRVARRALLAALGQLLLWHERAAERRHLLMMDDRMLKDIGLTRADIETEAHKPFWQP